MTGSVVKTGTTPKPLASWIKHTWGLSLAACLTALATAASAHEASGGFILLMPTELYILGASIAVLASFMILAVLPARLFHHVFTTEARPGAESAPTRVQVALSLASFVFVLFLLFAALIGPDDPLTNPISLGVWTLGWIVMSAVAALVINPWPWLNPWTGLMHVTGLGQQPKYHLPNWTGHWIAVVQMFYLIWVDLISLHAMDPEALFVHLLWFVTINACGMMLFGTKIWTERCEPLHVLFALLGSLAPLWWDARGKLRLSFPGARVLAQPALGVSASAFIILMLATGTFDGLSSTFHWLSILGQNPLEFTGRSAVMVPNTIGLILAFAGVSAAFFGALWLGERLSSGKQRFGELAGRFVYTLLPIYVVYMLSHFSVRLLMDAQYLRMVISDPLSRGWDLFGTAHAHPSASMFNTEVGVHLIWTFQTGVIALGHIIAVIMAHGIALHTHQTPRGAVMSQIPLAVLMVLYTSLGLWLLSTPKI